MDASLTAALGAGFLLGLRHAMDAERWPPSSSTSTSTSTFSAVVYVVVFGLGATVGMLALTGLMGIPFALTAHRSRTANLAIRASTGAVSLVLGIALAWSLAGD